MKFKKFLDILNENDSIFKYKNTSLGGGVVDYPPSIKLEDDVKLIHASYKNVKDLVVGDKVFLGDPDTEGFKEDNIGIITHIDKSQPDEVRVKYGYNKTALNFIYDPADYIVVK